MLCAADWQRQRSGKFCRYGCRQMCLGDMPVSHWAEAKDGFILDVRESIELAVESLPGRSKYSPVASFGPGLANFLGTKKSMSICRSGGRAYFATRILLQNGFKAKNFRGDAFGGAKLLLDKAALILSAEKIEN